jgi:hypothetical protein
MSDTIGSFLIPLTVDQSESIRRVLQDSCERYGLKRAAIICQPFDHQTKLQGIVVTESVFKDIQSTLNRKATP